MDNHFGVNTKDYKFNLNHLSLTMEKMISFITKYKVKLDSNFFILGLFDSERIEGRDKDQSNHRIDCDHVSYPLGAGMQEAEKPNAHHHGSVKAIGH